MDNYLLKGDLVQMATQKRFLKDHSFFVDQFDVYPVIDPEFAEDALQLLYSNSVDGWWCYQEDLFKYGICSKDEYLKKLRSKA